MIQYLYNEVGKRGTWEKLTRGWRKMSEVDVSGEMEQFLDDNPDFTNGVDATVAIASIPYRSVSTASNLYTAGEVMGSLKDGNIRQALLGLIGLVAGKGAESYVAQFSKNQTLQRAGATAASELTSFSIEKDCLACE